MVSFNRRSSLRFCPHCTFFCTVSVSEAYLEFQRKQDREKDWEDFLVLLLIWCWLGDLALFLMFPLSVLRYNGLI